jgi:hypothetical protein
MQRILNYPNHPTIGVSLEYFSAAKSATLKAGPNVLLLVVQFAGLIVTTENL